MAEQTNQVTLSEREQQVLQMVATGASNQQIARELVISINTVKVHMRNIFEKLGVQSRTEASMWAIQTGVVTVDENGASDAGLQTKTFLLSEATPVNLAGWQQIYLTVAVVLALSTLLAPIFYHPTQTPYLPILSLQSAESPLSSNQAETIVLENNSSSNRWTARSPMMVKRARLAVATYEGRIYAIGGLKANNKAARFVEIYDPGSNEWAEGSSKKTAVVDIQAATISGNIYVPGGCTADDEALDILEIYDPTADEWTQGTRLPAPRCGYGLATLNNLLYLFGGWDGTAFTDTVFVYTPQTDQWEILETTLPTANGYMGVAVLEHTVYLVGGYSGREVSAKTYAFDSQTKIWAERASMAEKRAGLGLVTINHELYAFGGGWLQPVKNGEKYNPQSNMWSTFETPAINQWRNLGSTVVETQIYAIGGWDGNNQTVMDDIYSHNVLFELFIPVSIGGN